MISFNSQDKLDGLMAKLKDFNLSLTSRELAILEVSIAEMEQAGYKPFKFAYFVQVVSRAVLYHLLCNFYF